jgi:hypothetical protein
MAERTSQRTSLPADVARHAASFARALNAALRSWAFYPPEHPAVALGVDRFVAACTESAGGGLLQIAVTPHQLLVDGIALESGDMATAECAALLHDRDILQLTLVSPPSDVVARALLTVLTLDRETRRARGGPAAIWSAENQASILIEQIDYQEILEREFDEGAVRRDTTWKSIVRSIVVGRSTFTAEEQQRLLEISRDAGAVGELCKDVKEPFCTPDGSPLVTTQAATVHAVYRHIASTVTALEPERGQEVIGTLGLAAGNLDPGVALEVVMHGESDPDGQKVAAAIRQSFDDQNVAMLLARALASPGHPTSRLAQVLDTLAPDAERKRRVLTLAKRLINERDMGGKRPIDDIRQSLDELLLKYDESTYVSAEYRQSMDVSAGRAGDMARRALPDELPQWLETLGHESVRRLSGILLIDLLRNETTAERMAETARDMAGFVEELLLTGVYAEALPVIDALNEAAKRPKAVAPAACREAVGAVARSTAFGEAAAGLTDQSAQEFDAFTRLVAAIGPVAVPALLSAYGRDDSGPAGERVSKILIALGPPAIPAIAELLDEPRWFIQRDLATVLGAIGTGAAVSPLQSLLRRTDPRVMRAAVAALAGIDDPAAGRALHTVLRAAAGEARAAVITALSGLKHPRVVPLLTRILQESEPFGAEHPLVLDMMSALSVMRDDRAVPPIAAIARHRRWLAWGKTTRLRQSALAALARIGSPKSQAAVDDLARTGDFFLKRMARRTVKAA